MPLYSYQVITADGRPGEVVEIMQGMNEPVLTHHPETGMPMKRLLSCPSIALRHTDRAVKNMVNDNKRLEQLGFTKYERVGKGILERKVGSFGPKHIGGGEE